MIALTPSHESFSGSVMISVCCGAESQANAIHRCRQERMRERTGEVSAIVACRAWVSHQGRDIAIIVVHAPPSVNQAIHLFKLGEMRLAFALQPICLFPEPAPFFFL